MDCRVLFIGDIMGKPGRTAVTQLLPKVRDEFNIDCVIGNGENIAGGKGIELPTFKELTQAGIDVVTSGNHVWDKNEVTKVFGEQLPLLRPANYPHPMEPFPQLPGKDYWIWESPKGFSIGVLNLMGRVFMDAIDCPFDTAARLVPQVREHTPVIIVDMHAEATSEKMAMGWYLDGKVSAVVGSHSHVPTNDARLLLHHTAYQTDAGMTGPYDSVIGMRTENVLEKFVTKRPKSFEVASNNVWLSAICITIDTRTGQAKEIFPVRRKL